MTRTAEMPPVQSYVLYVDKHRRTTITLEQRGHYDEDRWAILDGSACLSSDSDGMYFILERLPSNRSEEFLSTTRFTLEEALKLWRDYLPILQQERPWLKEPAFAFGQDEPVKAVGA